MRILIATGIYPPQIGGPATYSKLLYDELPKRGISVEVASFGEFLSYPWGLRHVLYFFSILTKATDADIVYAQDPVSVGLPALLASQIRGKKFVVKIVGDYAWEQGKQRFSVTESLDEFSLHYMRYPWQVKIMKKIEKYVADGAKRIITPSEYLKSIISNWGVDTEKISVIYNGFHMIEMKKTPSAIKKSLVLRGGVIVSVGRLVPWKGMVSLIESFSALHATIADSTLVIVGDGPERERLEGRVAELGLSDSVLFTGQLDQVRAFEYVKAADVFALNTSYEGFSHQLLETMALGTTIVTTGVGGNRELIKDGENGLIVDVDDVQGMTHALVRILSDKKYADTLSRRAKRDVNVFTDEIMLSKLEQELKTL